MTYSAAVLADAPLAYYRLGEASGTTMVDSSGNGRDGVYTSVTLGTPGLLTGDPDTCLTMTAVSDGTVSDAAWMDTPAASIEAWIATTDTAARYLAGRFTSSTAATIYIDLAASNVVRVYALISGTVQTLTATVSNIRDGNPHHIVGTYDGTTLCLYVDGALVNSAAYTGSLSAVTAPLVVGRRDDTATNKFVGKLDEVAYYGTALSGDRIAAHYVEGLGGGTYESFVLADAPTLYWKMDETSGTTAVDSSGATGRDGTHVGGPLVNQASLLVDGSGKSVAYDGTNDYTTIASAAWMNTPLLTVECVMKMDATATQRALVFRDNAQSSTTNRHWHMRVAGTTFRVGYWDSTITSSNGDRNPNGPALAINTTYHLAMTFDGTTLKAYINGVQCPLTFAYTGAFKGATSQPIEIGRYFNAAGPTDGWYFDGNVDEVAVYDTALSATRISAHYAASIVAASSAPAVAATAFASGQSSATTTATVVASVSDTTATASGQSSAIATATVVTPYPTAVLADAPLAYYRLGEASGATMVDSSGNARHGTYAGGYTLGVAGALAGDVDTACTFNGASGSAEIPAGAWQNPSSLTVETWIRTTDVDGAIWDHDDYAGARYFQFRLGAGRIEFIRILDATVSLNVVTATSPSAINDGLWHHVAATYDGSTIRLYVDGALVTTTAAAGGINTANTSSLMLGVNKSGSLNNYLGGALDEAAYYGTALSGARILAHYEAGTGVASPATVEASVTASGQSSATVLATLVTAGVIAATAFAPGESHASALANVTGPPVETTITASGSSHASIDPPLPGATTITASGQSGANITASTVASPPIAVTITASGQSGANITASTVASPPIAVTITASGQSGANITASTVASGDNTNRTGGRDRRGIGQAFWEPVVVAPPTTLPALDTYVVAQAFSPVTIDGAKPVYTVQQVEKREYRDQIIIGGKDVTYFRGVPTPFPGFGLVEPLLYGPTTISFPQVVAAFEKPGAGALSWCRPGAPVVLQRVDHETGVVQRTDYRGLVVGYDFTGSGLTLQVGGEATGRAAMRNRQVPIFPARHDLGFFAWGAIQELGLQMLPRLGPDTGLPSVRAFGGTSMLEYLNQIIAMSWTTAGERWTIMPTAKGVYRMKRKDTTTIDGTVYNDDARTVADLHRDIAEEPNRIYMTGVTPEGQRVRFGAYPGLKQTPAPAYPMAGGVPFGAGTLDSDTISGDGITVMINRMKVIGYLTLENTPTSYNAAVTMGVRELQRDMGTLVTGTMGPAAWEALYDLSATGFSLRWSRILPAAERNVVRQWRRSGSGAVIGRNPSYNPLVPKVDRNVDAGTGFTRPELREWAQAELADGMEDNFVGSITFNMGGLIVGDHTPGDPITAADLMRARDLQPGMNLSLPLFNGTGIVVHVGAVTVDAGGVVTADVDTRARDAAEIWEVIARNRESRANPHREWLRDHRSSTETKDSIGIWDEVGGVLGDKIHLPASTWVVVPVVAGQEGTVRRLSLSTNSPTEFVCAIFGKKVGAGRLTALIGNPLTEAGTKRWAKESVRDQLVNKNILLYVAGSNEEPLGYYPKQKTADGDEGGVALLTGRWEDEAGFSYHTAAAPVLYMAFFAASATTIPAGRVLWSQLEAGA